MVLVHIRVSLPLFLPPLLSLKISKLLKRKEEKGSKSQTHLRTPHAHEGGVR